MQIPRPTDEVKDFFRSVVLNIPTVELKPMFGNLPLSEETLKEIPDGVSVLAPGTTGWRRTSWRGTVTRPPPKCLNGVETPGSLNGAKS
ncbi:hypothetical protein ABIE24_001641 [Mycetocola sp. 2940]